MIPAGSIINKGIVYKAMQKKSLKSAILALMSINIDIPTFAGIHTNDWSLYCFTMKSGSNTRRF